MGVSVQRLSSLHIIIVQICNAQYNMKSYRQHRITRSNWY